MRDWLFVEDHCAGIEVVLREGAAGEIYNVGGGDEQENIAVAERILELTGADRSLLRRVADREGHDRRYSLDTAKLRALGWRPQTPFEDGLRQTVHRRADPPGRLQPPRRFGRETTVGELHARGADGEGDVEAVINKQTLRRIEAKARGELVVLPP